VRGTIEYERGQLALAREHFEGALAFAREWGAELLQPFYCALRGAVAADADDLDASRADLAYADAQRARFGDDPVLLAAVSLSRGHLDLALARAAASRGDAADSLAHRARAEGRLSGSIASRHVFEDLRPMRRRLERALAHASGAAPLGLAAKEEPERQDALLVAEDGSWFRVPGGARVDVSRRPNLRRLLLSLTTQRIGAPGEALSLDAIFRSGWPGERAKRDAAENRARVAMARLRKLGLGDLLVSRDGYLIDPDVPISVARKRVA
jgi:hypothetical protein